MYGDSMLNMNSTLREITSEKLTVDHLAALQTATNALRGEQFRASAGEGEGELLRNLFAALSRLGVDVQLLLEETSSREDLSLCLKTTAECFRGLRNACVRCPHNQSFLRDQGSIKLSFEILAKLLQTSPEASSDSSEGECGPEDSEESTGEELILSLSLSLSLSFFPLAALRCGVQFLGNVSVGNQLCKDDVWQFGSPQIFWDLLQLPDEKSVAYTCMVIHTCLDDQKTAELVDDVKVSLKIMELCRSLPAVDWTVLIATQHFFKSSELIRRMYIEMTDEERLALLELILAQLGVAEEQRAGLIPLSIAHFLASCFTDHCRDVLTLGSDHQEAALVVVRLLEVLCEMTSDCKEFMALQDHSDLLSTTVDLLKEVDSMGKTSRNVFTAAHDFCLTSPEGADACPAHSVKAHLIRLIGNLCHRHVLNQDKVREMDGIALILDNCCIDSKNPFISQWAVFALRNILEHNQENQKLIQGLRRQGLADDTLVRDMGFRVEERDGSLLLRCLKKDP
ncbi:hypothetical protein DNTS_016478 [Danionella cerebrum]|uniref:Ataxin-10 n=1 Tax=Danionella cerebrum TaxID=2873325 RepID=A0A553QT43_9TELE|nr:hypothetical protein DNTS_016478 [Danionella translucida]